MKIEKHLRETLSDGQALVWERLNINYRDPAIGPPIISRPLTPFADCEKLLARIEVYLQRTGMTKTTFSFMITKSFGFVESMRKGRRVRESSYHKAIEYLDRASHDLAPAAIPPVQQESHNALP